MNPFSISLWMAPPATGAVEPHQGGDKGAQEPAPDRALVVGAVPGELDKATLGHAGKYTWCIAEAEDELRLREDTRRALGLAEAPRAFEDNFAMFESYGT